MIINRFVFTGVHCILCCKIGQLFFSGVRLIVIVGDVSEKW